MHKIGMGAMTALGGDWNRTVTWEVKLYHFFVT